MTDCKTLDIPYIEHQIRKFRHMPPVFSSI
jgi:hypothetical protein